MTWHCIPSGETLVLFAALLLCGCSSNKHPELRPVEGTVIFRDEPVEDASVAFYNEKSSRLATGRTDADGKFTLTSFHNNDGALPGEHVVVVSKPAPSAIEEAPKLSMDEAAQAGRRLKRRFAPALLPKKYASPDTSPLRVQVEADQVNDITIELTDD